MVACYNGCGHLCRVGVPYNVGVPYPTHQDIKCNCAPSMTDILLNYVSLKL